MAYKSFEDIRNNRRNICEVKQYSIPVKGVYKGESDNSKTFFDVLVVGKAVNVRTGRNLAIFVSPSSGEFLTVAAHHIAINGYRMKS